MALYVVTLLIFIGSLIYKIYRLVMIFESASFKFSRLLCLSLSVCLCLTPCVLSVVFSPLIIGSLDSDTCSYCNANIPSNTDHLFTLFFGQFFYFYDWSLITTIMVHDFALFLESTKVSLTVSHHLCN